MLHIEGLVKRYSTGDFALRGVDLSVPQGQVLMVIGPSGAGKSTLIKCINRLVEPTQGRVVLAGSDITALRRRALRAARRRIGMIFQDFALVDRLTVMENILIGRLGYVSFWRSLFGQFPAADVARALELLDRLGLREHLDKRADKLSGGQRQRVAIARALMQTRELLLVDEPTASLDPRTARRIMRLINQLARELQLTAVVNIHDVSLARQFADRIVGLRDGAVVFDGPPQQLTAAALTTIYGDEDWHAEAAAHAEPEATPSKPSNLPVREPVEVAL